MTVKNKKSLFKRLWYLIFIPITLLLSYIFVFHAPNTSFKTEYQDYYVINDSLPIDNQIDALQPSLKSSWTFTIANALIGKDISKGLHMIPRGASNSQIIHLLNESPKPSVQIQIANIRFRYNLTSTLCKNLDVRSRSVRRELGNLDFIKTLDTSFTKENVYTIFIQDSLWVYRDATAKEVVKCVYRKWRQFWTTERIELANEQGLTPIEAGIMASIVHSESNEPLELPRIAGLYFNRLDTNMRLQADPTIVFAWQKNLRRIRKKHLKIRSKYNTYKYKGLPPGPVFTASKEALEATLHPEKHDFFFFVANPHLDGKHDFSTTYKEHLEKAKSYTKVLNKKKIY